jgi:hypothetical protein
MLETRQKRLEQLGPERAGTIEQMAYLTKMATQFQRIVTLALTGSYGADKVFDDNDDLRIAPIVMARMKAFSDVMASQGQTYAFMQEDSGETKGDDEGEDEVEKDSIPVRWYPHGEELFGIQYSIKHHNDSVRGPKTRGIKTWLREIFLGYRGFELGTFNGLILATAMKRQSVNWHNLSLGFVSDVIVMAHKFILAALKAVCDDSEIRLALESTLVDDLTKRYEQAIANAKFLLEVESCDTPTTLNHYFNDNLQKSRQNKATAGLDGKTTDHSLTYGPSYVAMVRLADVKSQATNMSNDEFVICEIHDILKSYYKVSRKTFVDNICRQAASYYLLHCETSPLALFSPIWVSQLSAIELEEITGEAAGVKRARSMLTKEIDSLKVAMKILARN